MTIRFQNALAVLAVAVLAAAGCDRARPVAGNADASSACTTCHGDATRLEDDPLVRAAPPVDAGRHPAGAHLAHLRGGAIRGPIACGECHEVPSRGTHANGVIDVPLQGALARAGGASPSWTDPTCASVYCHGATLVDGPAATPAWASSSSLGCTACHGAPPSNHDPSSTNCSACHPGTVKANGTIDLAGGLHVDGIIEVNHAHPSGWAAREQHGYSANATGLAGCKRCHGPDLNGAASAPSCTSCHTDAGQAGWATSCTFCHGDRASGRASPPVDAQGRSDAALVSVGAHAAHLTTTITTPLACGECHPARSGSVVDDPAHVDGDGVAEVSFGALARTGGAAATYTRTGASSASCSSVYCHGAFPGGANASPGWTSPAQATCSSCHGAPPSNHDSASTNCSACHPDTVKPDGTIDLAKGRHLNGVVDVARSHPSGWAAREQHGYSANATGLAGCKTCHGADLNGASGPSCTACHANASQPAWATSCTFCHGDRASGRPSPPVDTQGRSDPARVSVGAHAAHLTPSTTAPLSCGDCHPARSGSVVDDPAHVDGDGVAEVTFGALARTGGAAATYTRAGATSASCSSVYCHGAFPGGARASPDWTSTAQATCSSCHGAPPSNHDPSSTSCSTCHPDTVKPDGTIDLAKGRHLNGVVDVTRAHPAGWAAREQHGYSANATGLAGCKTCHGADLNGASGPSCTACHANASQPAWATSCTFCHGDRASGRASPPLDTQGQSDPARVSVGVHAAHVTTTLTTPLACTECHPARSGSVVDDPAHVDGNGVAEVVFGALARTGGAAATYTRAGPTSATCSSVYCHGAFTGGARASPGWTSTSQATCSSCHAARPSSGRHGDHSGLACAECHGHAGSGATHLNGRKDVPFSSAAPGATWNAATGSCGSFSCHGESHGVSRTW